WIQVRWRYRFIVAPASCAEGLEALETAAPAHGGEDEEDRDEPPLRLEAAQGRGAVRHADDDLDGEAEHVAEGQEGGDRREPARQELDRDEIARQRGEEAQPDLEDADRALGDHREAAHRAAGEERDEPGAGEDEGDERD